ncbi:MAG: hypothetical protein R3F20_02850 [Planctomycetota bacterium]
MTKTLGLAFALVAFWSGGLVLTAQETADAAEKPAAKTSANDEAVVKAAEERARVTDGELNRKMKEYMAAEREKSRAEAEKAKAEGRNVLPAMRMAPPAEYWAGDLAVWEKALAGETGAARIPYLFRVALIASRAEMPERAESAATELVEKHLDSASLGDYVGAIAYGVKDPKRAELLGTLEAKSPHGDVRAQSIVSRVGGALKQAPLDSTAYAAARASAVKAIALATSPTLKAEIQSMIDGREKFAEGVIAPDISGVDLDGVSFKLSDYKGKIILLDFWGDW